jgi:hypothetical protein
MKASCYTRLHGCLEFAHLVSSTRVQRLQGLEHVLARNAG